MLTIPLLPAHVELVVVTANAVGPGELTTVTVVEKVQPFASLTITVYVPAP